MTWAEHACVRPGHHVILKLPSGLLKPLEVLPNRTVNIGKFGSFYTNSLLGRPYHLTFEITDELGDPAHPKLAVVPAVELNSETLLETGIQNGGASQNNCEPDYDLVGDDGTVIMRNNRLTIDDPSRQALTLSEIEELKKMETGSGKDVIAKIMAAHSAIGEKTSFSLAKYTLRKSRKYLKRFTVLPADIRTMTEYMLEKDAPKIMDLRTETLGLLTSWANVHHSSAHNTSDMPQPTTRANRGRVLVVDDTSGLLVAALAEKMGILYAANGPDGTVGLASLASRADISTLNQTGDAGCGPNSIADILSQSQRRLHPREAFQSATANTITLVHAQNQPNLALLKYWGYHAEETNPKNPLFSHIKTASWLQILDPDSDALYSEQPQEKSAEDLSTLKTGKKGNYFKKLRRWQRVKRVVDDTRAGEFDALVIASFMDPKSILKHLVPLVKGGGQVVVYSPNVEPLAELVDLYSRERRGAYLRSFTHKTGEADTMLIEDEDFPVDPTLLLHVMLQTTRAVEWQVLPGRTHPLMTSRGGPEGYLFTATRVIPHDGPVAARGKFGKKRKAESAVDRIAQKAQVEDVVKTCTEK